MNEGFAMQAHCTTVKIVKINPVRSGIAQASQKPYEWHTVDCFLLDDEGNVSTVGVLNVPKELRKRLGGVPPLGTYKAIIGLVALPGQSATELRPEIIDLVPLPSSDGSA